jgi:hypothetical protein
MLRPSWRELGIEIRLEFSFTRAALKTRGGSYLQLREEIKTTECNHLIFLV